MYILYMSPRESESESKEPLIRRAEWSPPFLDLISQKVVFLFKLCFQTVNKIPINQ